MAESEYDYLFKIVIIGDSGVGKSQLLSRFTKNVFNQEQESTVGVDFVSKQVKIDDKVLKIQLWDTAGQERYRAVASSYYKGALGAILVYDITDSTSFDNLQNWIKELQNKGPPGLEMLVVGNKSDLEEKRQVTEQMQKKFAGDSGLDFIETSALTYTNVDEAFKKLIN